MDPDDWLKLNKAQQFASKKRWNLIFKMLDKISFSSVLDIGCGSGAIMREIKNRYSYNCKCYGCDLYENKNIKERANFVKGDAQKLPFKNAAFDLIITSEMIEHLPRPHDFLKEAYRVLENGGFLLIGTPNWWRFSSLFGGVNKKLSYPKITFDRNRPAGRGHEHEFSPRELQKNSKKYNFEMISIEFTPFNPHIFPFSWFDLPNLYGMLDRITDIKLLKPITKAHQYLLTRKRDEK